MWPGLQACAAKDNTIIDFPKSKDADTAFKAWCGTTYPRAYEPPTLCGTGNTGGLPDADCTGNTDKCVQCWFDNTS